jgi:hypothetical protein
MSKEISEKIKTIFTENGITEAFHNYQINIDYVVNDIMNILEVSDAEKSTKSKLVTLFDYEKHYLNLIKEFKEEIKFANNIQEEIRKERVQFFTHNLKEVANSLLELQVESVVASKWVQELVDSYTKSLDLSADLANTNVIDIIGKLRNETKQIISDVRESNEQE